MIRRERELGARLHAAQSAVVELAFASTPFAERVREVMRVLHDLVPAETVNLGTVDFATREGSYHALDGFLMPPQRRALLPLFLEEHPMLKAARDQHHHAPLRFSDFYSRREFEEKPLYRECYRGYTHSMLTFNVPAPSGLNVSFVLSRDGREFTDAERDLIALLQPVIVLFMENALLSAALELKVAADKIGVILGSGTRIQHMDTEGEHLLRTYFPGHARHYLPEGLVATVVSPTVGPVPIRQTASRTLHAHVRGRFAGWSMGLAETVVSSERRRLTSSGLTGREIEILEWAEKGKSNSDIGIILGISPRTVEKHMERVFNKLGVDSRHAAARRFRDLTRQG